MSEEIIERIEQYLNGELSPEQKSSFEKELLNNEELKKQVAFIQALPKAVQVSTEDTIRKQLKEIESGLPKVKFEMEGKGEATKVIPMPSPVSGSRWMQYAIAVSVLLLVGLFIFKDQIFKDQNTVSQIAEKEKSVDSLNTVIDVAEHKAKQLAVYSIAVTSVEDGKFGFVKNSLEKKVSVIVEVDTTLMKKGVKYGLYKFQNDSLFILTGVLETKISIYNYNVKAQTGQMIDSTGQLLEYEKPELKGMFLAGFGNYFRIEKQAEYSPLVKVNPTESELLKFYTK